MTRKLVFASLALLSLALAPACNKGGASGSAPAISPQAKQEAQEIFASRCAVCHGAQGAGDGAGSAGLTPKPRNFQDKAWQGSVKDDYIVSIIKSGGAAVGKSPAMPPNPDLAEKTEVLNALAAHVRGLAK
ncbi:MAG TPA: c-type cytochrome [Pseudomonadota bacterium]|jgi:mono/diheme cytochrome c family protein|nr:c-type cytochrome [Pseudomonadota bacterium]HND10629.1 c-type cytochrome [Pseudomonadota bacterium]HNF96699.1 c-type cytochrome [Pseudomonadota bacterium]HNK43684.1 c-type cytochrome [Pseudomonadota bacterium]HNN50083.1 c-type cytochrome [Pseudomonadota bacterium]